MKNLIQLLLIKTSQLKIMSECILLFRKFSFYETANLQYT